MSETLCLMCGNPLEQVQGKRGHRPKIFCSDRCRQRHKRQEDEAQAQAHIAQLEKEIEELKERLDIEERHRLDTEERQNIKSIEQYAMDCAIGEGKAKERIAHLEQELARYRQIVDIDDRQGMVEAFLLIGEEVGHKQLLSVGVATGPHAWETFSKMANDERLAQGLAAARRVHKQLKDLQTTTEVAQLNTLVAELQYKLHACEKKQRHVTKYLT